MHPLTVVMPTIADRRQQRIPTIAQLTAMGLSPRIVEQDPDVLPSREACRQNAIAALRTGPRHGHVLLVEDDVDVAPALANWQALTGLCARGPVALWHRQAKHPASGVSGPAPRGWCGTLGVLLTAEQARQAADLCTADADSPHGWDITIRKMGVQLAIPALVQHRKLPRAATRGAFAGGCNCYRGPDSHDLMRRMWEWLPARRDRRRVTLTAVAAVNLGISHTEAAWVLRALEMLSCCTPEPAGGHHRGLPLPEWAC